MTAPEIGDPSTTAVVCVECQEGVLGADSVLPALRADAAAMIAEIARLLRGARGAGVRVVHATFEGTLGGDARGTAPLWRRLGPATADWAPGRRPTAVLPELLESSDIISPRHHGLSPAAGTELLPLLRGFGVRTIVLVGVSLNLALPLTAGEATDAGFRVVVPRGAVAGTPAEYGELVLANTMALLGTITTVDELLERWTHSLAKASNSNTVSSAADQ